MEHDAAISASVAYPPAALALFDFDGTITNADSFTPFLRFAGRRARLLVGGIALSPLIVGYKLGLVSPKRAREPISGFAFRGQKAADVRALGARYAREVIPGLLRPEALARIAWHKQQGHAVAVVSASLDVYLDPWCQSLEIERISAELEERDGILTGRYAGGDCCGPEKSRRIRARFRLDDYSRIYAYGDTHEDLDMLGMAHEAYYRWKEHATQRS